VDEGSSQKKIFVCPKCGTPYESYPPNESHTKASAKQPSKRDAWSIIKMEHDCSVCKTKLTIYWYEPKTAARYV
jgi:hypothetical protein